MKLEDLEVFRTTDNDEGWDFVKLSELFLSEIQNPNSHLQEQLNKFMKDYENVLVKAFNKGIAYPYRVENHFAFDSELWRDSFFEFIFHYLAFTEKDILNPDNDIPPIVHIGVLPIPGSLYYLFQFGGINRNFKIQMDIFKHHVWQRYAKRALGNGLVNFKMPEIQIPSSFRIKMQPLKGVPQLKNEDLQKLFDITSTFYSRNHFNVLQESKEVLSNGAQECGCFEQGQRAFLWVDGITYADNFSNDLFEIIVHKTFLGFDELQKDQKEVLFPEYILYLQKLQSKFPMQFDGKTIEKLKASFKMDSNN